MKTKDDAKIRLSNSTGWGIVTALLFGHVLLLPMSTSGSYFLTMLAAATICGTVTVTCYVRERKRNPEASKIGVGLVLLALAAFALLSILPAFG